MVCFFLVVLAVLVFLIGFFLLNYKEIMHKLDRNFQNFGGIWGFMRTVALILALIFGIFAWIKCHAHVVDAGINVPENLKVWDDMHKKDEEKKDRESEKKVNDGTASPEDYERYLQSCS